jgi:predicted secreted hydrolase
VRPWRKLIETAALAWAAGLLVFTTPGHAQDFAVLPEPLNLSFPVDFGSHDAYRTEWWYVTGWLDDDGHPVGFQLTFFRTRLLINAANTSAFAPRQVYFAHAALSDPRLGRVLFAERSARGGFGLAEAKAGDTDVHIQNWRLMRDAKDNRLFAKAEDATFALDLAMTASGAPLLEGDRGLSQKGPDKNNASAYYSLPQLLVTGTLREQGKRRTVTGRAWLDHEWSTSYLDPDAKGWDWLGVNFDDGGALMAFQMRRPDGTALYSAATRRFPDGNITRSHTPEVSFTATRTWRSPHTGVRYPVSQQVRVGASVLALTPLMDDQEIDASQSTGTIYWEGAVRVVDQAGGASGKGNGYLELTGYGSSLRLH